MNPLIMTMRIRIGSTYLKPSRVVSACIFVTSESGLLLQKTILSDMTFSVNVPSQIVADDPVGIVIEGQSII